MSVGVNVAQAAGIALDALPLLARLADAAWHGERDALTTLSAQLQPARVA